jgi:hypothetical protein
MTGSNLVQCGADFGYFTISKKISDCLARAPAIADSLAAALIAAQAAS